MNDGPRRHLAAVGAGVVALYVAVAVVTVALSSRHVRPLFEGALPSAPYRWVKPPSAFAAGNQVPQPSTTDVPLDAGGSKAIGVTTEDGQAVLNLPAGAMGPSAADTSARVVLTPLDPSTLAAPPPGLLANGNVYQVQLAYQPSGDRASIKVAGNIILTVPSASTTMLYSADGKAWQHLATQQVGGPTVIGSQFTAGGYFVGTAVKHGASTKGTTTSSVPTVVLAVVVAALALAIFALPIGLRRLRRSRASAPPVGARSGRRPAPAKSRPKKRRR